MITQKKVNEQMNRIPISLTFLECFGFLGLGGVACTSTTLFSNTGLVTLSKNQKSNI